MKEMMGSILQTRKEIDDLLVAREKEPELDALPG